MRLVGYSAMRPALDVRGVYLPLGPLTVLLGANDAGKTTLLRALYEDLDGGPPDEGERLRDGGAFFAEVTDAELGALLPKGGRNVQPDWSLGAFGREVWDELPDETDVGAYVNVLRRASASQPPSFAAVLEQLGKSRLICLEPVGRRDGAPVFAVFWCLPPIAELEPHVAGALRESGLLRFRRERKRAKGTPMIGEPMRRGGAGTWHLEVEAAPVTIAPLAWPPHAHMPRPLWSPSSFDAVAESIAAAVSELVHLARFGVQDSLRDDPYTRDEQAERTPPRLWLAEDSSGAWRPHAVAEAALRIVEDVARARLPPFVTDRYLLHVDFAPVDRWFEEPPMRLRLSTERASGYRRNFDIENVAEGLRLWLQLALAGGAADLVGIARELRPLVDAAAGDHQILAGIGPEEELPLAAGIDVLEEALERIAASTSAVGARAALRSDSGTRPIPELDGPRQVVVADEPERQLNARVARQATGWIADLVETTGTLAIVASHGTAFLALARDVAIARVRRLGQRICVDAMTQADAGTLDEIARELGLHRGELLATVGCFLLVEGEHDKIVLTGIFGHELRVAGVFIAPMRGTGGAGLFDSDTLWRFTTAPALMVTDRLDPNIVRLTDTDPQAAIARLADPQTGEQRALLAALKEMRGTGKRMYFAGHLGTDLIDALDETVITSVHECFPGHAAAKAAYALHCQTEAAEGRKPLKPKSFYEREYRIPAGNEAYAPLAQAHVRAGVRPPALESIVARAVELAVEFRASY